MIPFPFQAGQFGMSNDARDPHFASVSLLLNCFGADGSTSIIDSSRYGHTVTAVGDAQISGNSLLLDGGGDYLTIPDSAAFDFGTGDFTWEFEVNADDLSAAPMALHQLAAGGTLNGGWFIELGEGAAYAGAGTNSGAFTTFSAAAITPGAWVHIALGRYGNNIQLWVNGALINTASRTEYAANLDKAVPVHVGGGGSLYPALALDGRMRAIRMTKGVRRYTGAFTPPQWPLPAY